MPLSPGAAGLRRLRRAAGLSQEQLADRCRLSERTIRSLESGTARRPHGDTLRAVGTALALAGSELDAFVATRRTNVRDVETIFHAGTPDDVVRTEYDAQRKRVRLQLMSTEVRIGPDRQWGEVRMRRTFQAVDEVAHFVWMNGVPDGMDRTKLVPYNCVNVVPVDRVDLESIHATAFLGALEQTLQPGDLYSLSYAYDYRLAMPPDVVVQPDNEILSAVTMPVHAVSFEVSFDPAARPARAWRVRQATVDGPPVSADELPISPFGVVQDVLLPAPAGVHGIRWEWA